MWGQLVRNAREWVRMTAVYFPKELQAESLAYVQVQIPKILTIVVQQLKALAVLTGHVWFCLLNQHVDSYAGLSTMAGSAAVRYHAPRQTAAAACRHLQYL